MANKQGFFRFIPLLILAITLACFFYFRLYRFISFQTLSQHRQWLLQWTEKHYFAAVLIYILIYIIAVAISIPGAVILTLVGGFLFGIIFGTLYVVISATLGATILFLAARFAFAELLQAKAGPFVSKLGVGFKHNAFSYLLFLRLVPLFPFWLINIVPAVLGVRIVIFMLATFIGIIPGTFVYVLVGNGLSQIFASGKTPDLSILFSAKVLIPLVALGLLSLLPILYKKLIDKEEHEKTSR